MMNNRSEYVNMINNRALLFGTAAPVLALFNGQIYNFRELLAEMDVWVFYYDLDIDQDVWGGPPV